MSKGIKWGTRRPFSPAGSRSDGQRRADFEQRERILGDDLAQRTKEHIEQLEALVAKAKANPCIDCKTPYPPYVLQFDHLDESTKKFNISQFRVLYPSAAVLLEEIAKCELVCANCHAERTHRRSEAARAERERVEEARRQYNLRKATPPK